MGSGARASEAEVQLLSFWPSPFVMRVKVALAAKGVAYEELPEDLLGATGKSALLLESNPVYGQVPVLLHRGRPVCESVIIAEYIDEAFPSGGQPLLPPHDEPYKRTQARFWADFCDKKVFAAFFKILRSQGEEQQASMEDARAHLATLEGAYAQEPFPFFGAGGACVGMVDVVLAPLVAWLPFLEEMFGFRLEAERFPRVHAWVAAFRASPSLAACIPDELKLLDFARSFRSRFVPATASH